MVERLLDIEISNNNHPLTKVFIKSELGSGPDTTCQIKIAQYHLLWLKLEQSNIVETKYRMINKSRKINKIKHKNGDRILTWKTQMRKTTGNNKQIIHYNDERVHN